MKVRCLKVPILIAASTSRIVDRIRMMLRRVTRTTLFMVTFSNMSYSLFLPFTTEVLCFFSTDLEVILCLNIRRVLSKI